MSQIAKPKISSPRQRRAAGLRKRPFSWGYLGRAQINNGPFNVGEIVFINLDEDVQLDYLPCMPKPGTENPILSVPNKSWIKYCGMVTINGENIMEFKYQDHEILVGVGLINCLKRVPRKVRLA